jgi:hypothetical protein
MAHDQEKILNIIKFMEFLEKDIFQKIFKGKFLLFIQSSKEIKKVIEEANINVAINIHKKDYKFSNQEIEELSYKLNSLNTWCYMLSLIHI